jgi:hypothetical protein
MEDPASAGRDLIALPHLAQEIARRYDVSLRVAEMMIGEYIKSWANSAAAPVTFWLMAGCPAFTSISLAEACAKAAQGRILAEMMGGQVFDRVHLQLFFDRHGVEALCQALKPDKGGRIARPRPQTGGRRRTRGRQKHTRRRVDLLVAAARKSNGTYRNWTVDDAFGAATEMFPTAAKLFECEKSVRWTAWTEAKTELNAEEFATSPNIIDGGRW